ncbi:MAG TPA: ABC transporter permease [Ohtaekwangia sp.]
MTIDQDHITPPKWPLKLLRFFIKKEYLEEIEGDMEEVFRDQLEIMSPAKAKRFYTWEIIRLLRPVLMKNLEVLQPLNHYPMFRNYFKTSLRSFMRHPLNSFINVFGLSVSIGICVFAYGYARWVYNTDQFHEHKHQVHLVTFFAKRDGTLQQHGNTPRPLGEMLREDFTHIRKVCRIEDRNVVVKFEDNVFHERVRFTDPEFLEMFTFPLKWGTPGSLRDVNSIILSEQKAIKYFGDANPVGRDILLKFDENHSKVFRITGVAAEFPAAHTIDFGFLINTDNFRTSEAEYKADDWSAFVHATFIQVDSPADLTAIQQGMEKYKQLQHEAVDEDWAIDSFAFEPLSTLHNRSENMRDYLSWSSASNFKSIMFLGGIALFTLLLACFNYINIAITSAARRLKEIGVRKTIGATQRVVIIQFLTENIVVTSFALVLGLIFGITFFIPWFENMWHFNMGFTLNDTNLWIYLPAVLFFTAIASGSYPAFYISRFQATSILKGSIRFDKKNPLTKVFLGIQLVCASIFITAAVTFTQNSDYLANRSWGYQNREALYVSIPDHPAFEKLSALIAQDPHVVSISGSQHHLGNQHTTAVMHMPDRQVEVDKLAVDARYFETMGIALRDGRVFHADAEADKKAVVVNEALVKNLALTDPVGYTFRIDSMEYEIIGVVNDFHNYNFSQHIKPTLFTLADEKAYRYLSVKVKPGTERETYKAVQTHWATLYPETPFDGGYQEDVWGNYYEEVDNHASVWKVFAFIAVVLAGLGLYGLITFNVAGRVKEFSIRKILGAGIRSITDTITRQYLVLLAIAVIIGAPSSYLLINAVFDLAYSYHMPVTFGSVALSMSILLVVILVTLSTQIRKVLKANPVEGLKSE